MILTVILVFGVIGTLAVPAPLIMKEKNDADYLLPDNAVIPSNYKVTIDVSNSFKDSPPKLFEGEIKISAQTKISTNIITLHAADMNIINITVFLNNSLDKKESIYKSMELDAEKQFLHVELTENVPEDTNISMEISYLGTLQTDMYGFYISSYEENSKIEYVLTTQFQPTHARKAFPCFDEPKYKATFEITIKKPVEYNATISNMHLASSVGTTELTFRKTNKMSTYLVAFIVSKFNFNENSQDSLLRVWSRPNALYQTQVATDNIYPIIKALDKFTGINFSEYVPKMDLVALPDFAAGAMENWGLLTYRETALLVDGSVSTNKDIQRVVTVVAHEVAHQWFGDLVTLNWWNNTWLNEGFATYFQYHTTDNVTDNWEMKEQFVVDQLQSVFEVDALNKTTPLTYSVFTPQQISSHFGSISYNKGGSVIRMMEHFLGSDVFQEGLQNYLQKRKLQNTVPENLWTDLQEKANNKIKLDYTIEEIMSGWISQPGYPLITITVGENEVTFEQNRFFLNPVENSKSSDSWYVPITYTTSNENNFISTIPKLWLTPTDSKKTVRIDNTDWFIGNIQETGYYRVNYNAKHWKKLSNVLSTDEQKYIHRINRAQIIDDAMNLARAGIIDYEIAFTVTDYLATETDYYPWYSAFSAFRFLLQRYSEIENTGILLRKYILKLMDELLSEKTLTTSTINDKQTDVFNIVNALEWACNLGHETCVNDAKELFKAQLNQIDKNLRNTVYCTAIRYGTENDWNKLWDQYVDSNIAAEKVGTIKALGCSNDTNILESYLKKSIEGKEIRSQDASYVFSAVYTGNPKGIDAALNFLNANSQDIIDSYGGMNALDGAVLGLAGRLTDVKQIEKIKEILKQKIFDNIREAAIETINENQVWAEKYGSTIENILKQKRN